MKRSRKKKARRGMFGHAQSDDSTEFDDAPARTPRNKSPNQPGQTGSFRVVKKEQFGTKKVVLAEAEDSDDEIDANDDSDTAGKKTVGKPPTDTRKHAAPLWNLFQTADHKSLFFSSRSDVQRRMLARWINKASQRLLGPSCPEAAVLEDAKKKMQIMDMAVALYRKWQQRKELLKAQGLCQTIAHCRCNFPQNPSPT